MEDKILTAILDAYREGVFPMAESAQNDDFAFYRPYQRGLLPFKNLHIPQKLLKTLRQKKYTVTLDTAFEKIIDGCAMATSSKRDNTWINKPIRDIFVALHHAGHAHSIEAWNLKGELMGGLYGLSIGAVFCGESMVSFQTNGSKIALVYLCAVLKQAGYEILDTQFINPHLLQFGAYEIDQNDYEERIKSEIDKKPQSLREGMVSFACLEQYLEGIHDCLQSL